MRSRQTMLHAVTVDGVEYDLKDDRALASLDRRFARYFGKRARIWDLLEAFATAASGLTLDSVDIERVEPDLVMTRSTFHHTDARKQGSCTYYWRLLPDGTMERTRDAVLDLEGSRARLALQIHANMATFARAVGHVHGFEVEARQVGRYAYRFLHGVEIDEQTRRSVGDGLARHAAAIGVAHDAAAYQRLRSPRDLAEFIVLGRLSRRWMAEVDALIERQGYDFTVDQVVDVARRPALALLLDHPSYFMRLDITDDLAYQLFLRSVRLGRQRRALRRLRGLFGSPYQELPRRVRNALIVYRPYLFPRPRLTPSIPDLSGLERATAPWRVVGFRSADGVLLEALPADPVGARVRDYRAREVQEVIAAVESGVELVSVTGLSGSGKTELVIWRLEKLLTGMGHRLVTLDAMRLQRDDEARELLLDIDKVVRPTVTLFDESLYIRGRRRGAFLEYAQRFLKWPGQHLLFVGGGLESPARQRKRIERELADLWSARASAHVELLPKPITPSQAYRFLGLGRVDWLDAADKVELLRYVLERYPPYFVPLMPIRFHEHPRLRSLDAATRLVDENVVPEEWTALAGMVLEDR